MTRFEEGASAPEGPRRKALLHVTEGGCGKMGVARAGCVRLSLAMTAVLAVSAAYAALPANTSTPCSTWFDPVLQVEFPERLGGIPMVARRVYNSGGDNYSLSYGIKGGGVFDLYVFTFDHEPMADGVSAKSRAQLDEAANVVRLCYKNSKSLGMMVGGKLPKCGLAYEWTSFLVKFPRSVGRSMSIALVFSWRNRFVKIRYSMPVDGATTAPCETLPKAVQDVLCGLDDLIDHANKAGNQITGAGTPASSKSL
ncbi:MAG: hypothetical protein K6G91_04170 [Kiritimatiellae bacterium]|nr:hypothetical protein [Kiritimatiellia bacterium]